MGGKSGVAVVQVAGAADIQTIAAIHERLREAVLSADETVIDIGALGEFDLTFIQVIEAARLKAARTGKTVRLQNPVGEALCDALERGGFLAGSANRQFWLHSTGDF